MIEYFEWLFSYLGLEKSTCQNLINQAKKIGEEPFKCAERLYIQTKELNVAEFDEIIKKASELSNVDKRTVNLLVISFLTKTLKSRLIALGVPNEIIKSTLLDVKYKLCECQRVFGVDGLMEASWFKAILEGRCFGIGRLQFEIDKFRLDGYSGVNKGDNVLSIHIPSFGGALTETECKHSYEGAVSFFSKFFPNVFNDKIPFVSWTWLLYPKNSEFMSESSNILRFQKDFDIIETNVYKTNDSIAWRIFGVPEILDVNALPEDTKLRKSAKEYILNGNKFGWGYGVFIMNK